MQEEGTFSQGGTLVFPAETPLSIELEELDRELPLCGSNAKLVIISPGDRTYADLYTEQAGEIRLEVYRNGVLYWTGSLDPEFYEEPYAYLDDYEVTLAFSDFGALDRIKYHLNGIQTLYAILQNGLSRIGVNIPINQDYISTTLDGARCTLDKLKVRSDNFVDEDGEWMSMRDVIEGILQPLALKMVQRHGVVYVYDLNGLWQNGSREALVWQSDDQMMGAAEVANNAKVSLSVYADKTLISDELKLESSIDANAVNLQNTSIGVNSYYPNYSRDWLDNKDAYNNISFSIHYGASVKLSGVTDIGGTPFHIQPFFGGEEADGVAYMFMTGGHGDLKTGWPRRIGSDPADKLPRVLMRTNRVYIPKINNRDEYLLRVTEEILVDPRYNPFTEATEDNEEDNYDSIKCHTSFLFVPVMIQLYDESGSVVAHYNNASKCKSRDAMGFVRNQGEWKNGPDPFNSYISGSASDLPFNAASCFLEWYDGDDRKESTGILGWKKNRHSIGLSDKEVTGLMGNLSDGEFIPYPPKSGYLEVTIVTGVCPFGFRTFKHHDEVYIVDMWEEKGYYNKIRWMLYKAPSVLICQNRPPYKDVEVDDLEYQGVINEDAKEDVELDTIVGTSERAIPSSRALLMSSSTGDQVKQLTRAGRTATAEQLLIGTIYSQYASRKTKLTGTVSILKSPLPCLSENMQGDAKFLLVSDIENCKDDTTEITVVEFRPDEYTDN